MELSICKQRVVPLSMYCVNQKLIRPRHKDVDMWSTRGLENDWKRRMDAAQEDGQTGIDKNYDAWQSCSKIRIMRAARHNSLNKELLLLDNAKRSF